MTVHYCKNFTFKWKKGDGVGRGLKIILKRSFVKFKRFSHGGGEQIDKVLMLCVDKINDGAKFQEGRHRDGSRV